MNKTLTTGALLLASCGVLTACSQQQLPEQKAWETMEMKRVSVHDPSITSVKDKDGKETFYIFGSHLAEAKSDNLITWEVPFNVEYENPEDNIILGNLQENLKESFEWAGYDDGDAANGYAVWAPDVIWNENYKWNDGSKGAYMYFYSATSTWRRSCIGFAVAKTIEGPYAYGDTVVYSGFTEEDSTDGSDRNTNYEATNLKQLIKDGKVAGFSENWGKNEYEYNTDYAPNAIDPTLFYDADGKLWMTYGSWSGGIYLLELDQATGEPKYPGEDGTTEDGRVIDRYFGTKLSGGFHQSGEGPYIQYDEESGYYYYFITYGGLQSNGGYNMRLFRSEHPDGPYVDMNGKTGIIEKGDSNSAYGLKLMGNYRLDGQTKAYKSGGHNSFIITESGQRLLVYHTRFAGGEAHEVRVDPMEVNQDGWLVTMPFEYTSGYELKKVIETDLAEASYEFVMHGTDNEGQVKETQTITFTADHKITGDVTGTWQLADEQYIEITIDDVIYKGVVNQQKKTEDATEDTVVFSAVGENQTIWGVKKAGTK